MKSRISPSGSRSHRQCAGLSLVELMVALALSLLLMAGVLQIFLGSKQTYRAVEQHSRMQENARYVVEAISRATRNTAYTGCSTGEGDTSITNTLKSAANLAYDFKTGVSGFEAVGSGPGQPPIKLTSENPVASGDPSDWTSGGTAPSTVPTDVANLAIAGSDILILRIPAGNNVPIVQSNTSTDVFAQIGDTVDKGCTDPIKPDQFLNKISGICLGDIVLVSNCKYSRVFQVTALTESSAAPCTKNEKCLQISHTAGTGLTPGNALTVWGGSAAPLDQIFGTGAEILRIQTTLFFVGRDTTTGTPTLYQRIKPNNSQALVSGVENMQVLYGEDTDADKVANRYVTANNVANFNNVVSLRLSLLLRTDQPISQTVNTQTYELNGVTKTSPTTIDPFDDRRGRYVFTSTIKLRNR